MKKSELKALLHQYGKLYSKELGINLDSKKEKEIFKWFLASILFGKPIQENVAIKTIKLFFTEKLDSHDKILKAGWDKLVEILDRGGYVRYDFSTATKLLEIMKELKERYGSINNLYKQAKDSKDLETKLCEFKGIGPITANIFLRELRGIWPKANPELSKFVIKGAKKLKIKEPIKFWKLNKISGYDFRNFEAMLLRIGKK